MNLSRLEDIEDSDNVEIIDDNRAVIRTDDSDRSDDEKYRVHLELEVEGKNVEETLASETKEGLLNKMVSWYAGQTGLEADYL